MNNYESEGSPRALWAQNKSQLNTYFKNEKFENSQSMVKSDSGVWPLWLFPAAIRLETYD